DPEVERAGAGDGIAAHAEARRYPSFGAGDELARDRVLGRRRRSEPIRVLAAAAAGGLVGRGDATGCRRRLAVGGGRPVLAALDLRRQLLREPEVRVLRDAARQLAVERAVEDLVRGGVAAEKARARDRLPHGADHLRHEQRFELARDLERRLVSLSMLLVDALRRRRQERLRTESANRKRAHAAVLLTSARARRRGRRRS